MRALHLKLIGDVWHYQRRRPKEFADIEKRTLIRFSLKTTDFNQAKIFAAQQSADLDFKWEKGRKSGVSISLDNTEKRHTAAIAVTRDLGLDYTPANEITDSELLSRLRMLVLGENTLGEQKAVLGLIEEPTISLSQAFDRFWNYIQDEWMILNKDQIRVKRNVYLRAIQNFEKSSGAIPLHQIERKHALLFRTWWLNRVQKERLKPYSGNREINSLRRLITINFDIDCVERPNPFQRVRLKDTKERSRQPFTTEFIKSVLLEPNALSGLKPGLEVLVRMLINTGARPSELLGLELADIDLDAPVPFIHIQSNKTHALKTPHSERQIPLVGVSLEAAITLVAGGGWGKWLGKNMYATGQINKYFRQSGLVNEKDKSLYSLRHWFQDQLTKNDVVDRAQAQLMGHKFQRPKYGFGKNLSELRTIIEKFSL